MKTADHSCSILAPCSSGAHGKVTAEEFTSSFLTKLKKRSSCGEDKDCAGTKTQTSRLHQFCPVFLGSAESSQPESFYRNRIPVGVGSHVQREKLCTWECCSHKSRGVAWLCISVSPRPSMIGGTGSCEEETRRCLKSQLDVGVKACQSILGQFHGGICPMSYCLDSLLQFLRVARLRSCFVCRICVGPFPFEQPTHAADIV
eukprot:s1789_g8.t1